MNRWILIALAWASIGAAHAAAVLQETARIPMPDVQGRIDHLAADLTGKRIFVAALGNDTVEVIDVEGKKAVRTLKGFREPQGVLMVPQRARLLVTNAQAEHVSMVDTQALQPAGKIGIAKDGDNIRYDRGTGAAWVGAGENSHGVLAALDVTAEKVVREIGLQGHPESFQLEQNGPRIFVNVPTARTIQVIDRVAGKAIGAWSVPAEANFPMALDEASHRLFVGTRKPARLLVYDTGSGQVVANLPTVSDTDDVFYDAKARLVYVSGGEGFVYVYGQDAAGRYALVDKAATRKGARTSLFVPDWGLLFVAVPRQHQAPAEIRVFRVATPPSTTTQ